MVPANTPSKNQTQHPPPGAGRYMIRNVDQGRGYSLVRNPHFSPGLKGTAIDVAKVNGINVKINGSVSAEVTQIANNQADFMIDNPTADRAGEVRAKYTGKRYREFPTTSTYYFFMNTEAPPFDKPAVRQAVNWALDFDAINRIQAGFLSKTHGILPQQIPGYEPSSDLYPGPNLQKAQQLIAQAGAKGAQVTVWSDNEDPTPQTMAYYADLLNKIGLKAKLKTVAAQTYFAAVGDRSLKAADRMGELDRGLPASGGLHRRSAQPRQRGSHEQQQPLLQRLRHGVRQPHQRGGRQAVDFADREGVGGAGPPRPATGLLGRLRHAQAEHVLLGPDELPELQGRRLAAGDPRLGTFLPEVERG